MRIRFTVYKHAPLATSCGCLGNLLGGMAVCVGVPLILSPAFLGGIVLVAIGAGLILGSSALSEKLAERAALKRAKKAAFKSWWQKITDAKLEPEIAKSIDIAVQIYRINPCKKTLKKISALNPAAGKYIRQNIIQ